MPVNWCQVCCTRHHESVKCPGELRAIGPERHGWRVNVETPRGIEAYGVLVAEAVDGWRARIVTYPNVLWLVPHGQGSIKFAGRTPREAERQAIAFIRDHCKSKQFTLRDELPSSLPVRIDLEPARVVPAPAVETPAERKIRFLPVRYGLAAATEAGGTGNLSESGLFIITGTPLDSGSALKLMLELDEQRFDLEGAVRWMRQKPHVGRSPGMGVQLNAPPPSYLRYVRELE